MIYDKTMGSIWQQSQPKSAYLFFAFLEDAVSHRGFEAASPGLGR